MKFANNFHKTVLLLAIEKCNNDIINLLLSNKQIDPNIKLISK